MSNTDQRGAQTESRYEQRAEIVWDEIINFIKEHPEQCSGDHYYFSVGKNYKFWIANGFDCGDAFKCTSIHGENCETIPREFFTLKQKQRFAEAYHEWLENHYVVPKVAAQVAK